MPYTINPTQAQKPRPVHSPTFTDPTWSWLANQEYNPARIERQQTTQRRGTLTGGPSFQRFLEFGNEKQFTIAAPKPILTTQALPDEQSFYRRQLGAVEWDSINPLNTVDQLADQITLANGGVKPDGFVGGVLDAAQGAGTFLASKDVDLFGMGSTGAPARAADYALAFPIAIFNHMTGQASDPAHPLVQDDIYYKFHADPRYWQTVTTGTPEELDRLARTITGAYIDPSGNSYMVEQLRHQFDVDRAKALAQTSGNAAVDYQAKKAAAGVPWSLGAGFPKIPLIGTQVAEFIDPIKPEEQAIWDAKPAKERLDLLNHYGFLQMGTDFVGSLPALSGIGTVLSLAKGGGVVAKTLAEGYDWTLRGAGYMATAGLAAATTNWALEAVWPDYARTVGAEIDRSRPISGSSLAGVVNAVGYFASGTYGASNLVRSGVRAVGYARDAGAAVRAEAAMAHGFDLSPAVGGPEMAIYSVGHGGARMDNMLVSAGLDAKGLRLSKQRLVMSEMVHLSRTQAVDTFKAIARGEESGRIEFDNLPNEERMALASDELRQSVTSAHDQAALIARVLAMARKPARLFRSDEALQMFRWYKDNARTIDDNIASRYMGEYGPAWVNREAGAYTEAAIKDYVEKAVARVGGDPTALKGLKGEEQWAQAMRSVHQYEFDYRNGDLAAALEHPSPGGTLPNERGKLSVVSSRHLFHDDGASAIAVLRGDDAEAAQAMVNHLIDNTIEGERWFSNDWNPPHGQPHTRELVKPEQMASWIEDALPALLVRRGHPKAGADTADLPLNAFHTELAKDGVWDLAFKPVDAEGEFVSYVHGRDGVVFQTPWLDYPVGNADNIEIGNRGMAMAKYDSVFRGFRTWRIAEFQRASIYRSLTSRFAFTSSQVDAFHNGVLKLAREFGVQPQTMGTVSGSLAGVGHAYQSAVDGLAAEVFGIGPFKTRLGGLQEVDWRKEIAQGYRQSLRLNFTAGLTSHLKSRFGAAGSTAAWMSDIGYVNLRFNLSPLFKAGETVESLMYNGMRGANPGGDPWVEALMHRAGIGDDFGVLSQDLAYDQTLQGLGARSGKRRTDPATERQARAYSWYALNAPETFEEKAAAAAIQARVEAFQAFTAGGNSIYASPRHALEVELAGLTDDFGNILPGMDDRADEITKILTGELRDDEVRAMHHVSEALPSEEWSLDPFDLGARDYFVNDPEKQGAKGLDWVEPDGLPEDRGLWHATTAIDAVHARGLKSRSELIGEQWYKASGLRTALKQFNADGSIRDIELTYRDNGRVVVMHPNPMDLESIGMGTKAQHWGGTTLADPYTGVAVTPDQIVKVTDRNSGQVLWENQSEPAANVGLSASRPDSYVSTTTEYEHAATIAERLRMAISAAKNDLDPAVILDHFDEAFSDLTGHPTGFINLRQVASQTMYDLGEDDIGRMIANASNEGTLVELVRKHYTTGEQKYELVKKLDMQLGYPGFGGPGEGMGFEKGHRVVLVGKWEQMAKADPAQVGIVQVGIKKGASWRTGPDAFEVQVDSENLWVLDQRIRDYQLAEDKDGLTAQLRSTMDEKGAIKPGMQHMHDSIIDALIKVEKDAKPAPEVVRSEFLAHSTPGVEYVPLEKFPGLGTDAHGVDYHGQTAVVMYDPNAKYAFVLDRDRDLIVAAQQSGVTSIPTEVRITTEWSNVSNHTAVPLELPPNWKPKLDGTLPDGILPSRLWSREADQVSHVEDVFGTPEHLTQTIGEQGSPDWQKPSPWDSAKGEARDLWEGLKNPVPGKQHQATLLRIEKLRREFPLLLHAAGLDGVAEVFRGLGVKERDWLPFLMEDRKLATDFHNTGSPEAFQALLDHAGKDQRGRFDELYASEEWPALVGLFAIADKTAQTEAFRVHFFNPYRSAIERSINHPLMGVYPLSWAYKAAREWMTFLYENRTIPELRLGMSPAVAINSIVRAQNIAFAQSNPEDLETYIGTHGPFGSTFLIFNLLLPGDWSTIPFPMSRTIRDGIRGNLGARTLENNVASLGMVRDARLGFEMAGELNDFVWGPAEPDHPGKPAPPWRPHTTQGVGQAKPSTLGADSFR